MNFITIFSGLDIIVNQNDPMHMVWHDRKGIHLRVREMSRDFVPDKGPC